MKLFAPIAVFLLCAGSAFGQDAKVSNLRGDSPGEESNGGMDDPMEEVVTDEVNNDHRALTTKKITWRHVAGWASDIGAGQYGVVVTGGHDRIFKLNSNRKTWSQISGGANTVSVGKDTIQVVNRWDNYYEYEHGRWSYIPIHALDVGIYGDVVCVVRTDQKVLCHNKEHVYIGHPGTQFIPLPGAAVRVDVCPDGNPVVVNAHNTAYYREHNKWTSLPGGKFTDISCGGDGSIWAIGADQGIYKWNGHGWDGFTGRGVRISVDHTGIVWIVNNAGNIYEYKPEPCVLHHDNDHKCPAHPPSGGTCHAPAGVRCNYGQDRCCDKCFTERTCRCSYGHWVCYFNDSCQQANQCSPDV